MSLRKPLQNHWHNMKNHWKTMGQPWKKHKKNIRQKPLDNHGKNI